MPSAGRSSSMKKVSRILVMLIICHYRYIKNIPFKFNDFISSLDSIDRSQWETDTSQA